jgi:hypothetical protein
MRQAPVLLLALAALIAGCASPVNAPLPTGALAAPPSPAATAAPSRGASPTASGPPEKSAVPSRASLIARAVPYVAGTIAWSATQTDASVPGTLVTTTTSGSARLVLKVDPSYGFLAERATGSTYSWDYNRSDCSPPGHFNGTLETSSGANEVGNGIGNFLPSGGPGGDWEFVLVLSDQWRSTCYKITEMRRASPFDFPGCSPRGWASAKFDGADSYTIDCRLDATFGRVTQTGEVHGKLTPFDGPASSP